MLLDSYYQLDAEEPTLSPLRGETTDFLLRCLLGARREADHPSNESGYDEDVNVYLVGLLGRFLSPHYHEDACRYLQSCDLDLCEAAESCGDDRHAYRLYKINADHLMLAIGLFHHVEGAAHPGQPHLHREPDEFIARGGIYYSIASSRLHHLRRRGTGPVSTLRKLGDGFGQYVEILRHLRTAYFHLTARVGEGTLYHLSREDQGSSGSQDRGALYDAFLDCYSLWSREPSAERRLALQEAVARVREVDPDFAFELPGEETDPAS
jgi:hypothetical protein